MFPPLALVEAFITDDNGTPRVRRLHLIVVDLNRLPIPWKQDQEPYELRYVFGFAMDGTDLPCYFFSCIAGRVRDTVGQLLEI